MGIVFAFIMQVIKFIYRQTKILFKLLVDIIVYLGLYYTFFYLVVVLIIYVTGNLDASSSTNTTLFFVGLSFSLAISVVYIVKNKILRNKKPPSYKKIAKQNSKPLVYRSQVNKDLIIHEYEDHYDVYKIQNKRKIKIETKPKNIA